ncbi:MAG: hypothetical protein ACLR8Y_02760 [Alistipes indistinctus]
MEIEIANRKAEVEMARARTATMSGCSIDGQAYDRDECRDDRPTVSVRSSIEGRSYNMEGGEFRRRQALTRSSSGYASYDVRDRRCAGRVPAHQQARNGGELRQDDNLSAADAGQGGARRWCSRGRPGCRPATRSSSSRR